MCGNIASLIENLRRNLPHEFRGTIIEDAVNYIDRLKNVSKMYQIVNSFRDKFPRIRNLSDEEARNAFVWLAERIREIYGFPIPEIEIIDRAEYWNNDADPIPNTNFMNGRIQTTKSIISFLHELRHWIARYCGYSQNEYLVQKWAIAVWLLGYSDMVLQRKVEVKHNFFVVLKSKSRRKAERIYSEIEPRILSVLPEYLRSAEYYACIRETIVNAIEQHIRRYGE